MTLKSLPDLALLATPPDTWEAPYATIAREDQLRWPKLEEAYEAARAFLDPVLAGLPNHHWDPAAWSWRGGNE